MRQNYKIYLCALLLVGAVNTMTIGVLGADKPTLAVFVVGMQTNELGNSLAQQIGDELNRNSRYTVLSSAADPVKAKLTELRAQGARNIDRNALAEWGRTNGVSTVCLVTDDIKGSDNMFYALLIDAKDSKVSGRGSYIRTGVVSNDLPRVSLALSRQLDGPGRRHATPARSYPAELDIEMVFVVGGTFTIGCNSATETPCQANETPQRTVTVSSFSIGRYEITRTQWRMVMKGHALENAGYYKSDDQLTIDQVSWMDIDTAFLPRLRALTGKPYRLPTEAEWEYAARGCKAGVCDPYKYSGSDVLDDVAWYSGGSGTRTGVGQKKPNGLGIYDMTGGMLEWCSDWYNANYYKNTLTDGTANPKGPDSGTARSYRGGGIWSSVASNMLRIPARGFATPTTRGADVGFRVALPAQ
jgi:formylglycine-generating enzyme required for sulfatase activity